MAISTPSQQLKTGAAILLKLLGPLGFAFEFRDAAVGSGGAFAWGEFIRKDRRLEVHFRHSLGEVQYHVGSHSVRHEPYMRLLGVWPQCRYPGFSIEPLQVFEDLSHDLGFASDFTTGDGSALVSAAVAQKVEDDGRNEALLASYQGQNQQLTQMRSLFKQAKYAEVVKVYQALPSPQLLTDAELRLVHIAQRRDA
jgi:hypothetical protein